MKIDDMASPASPEFDPAKVEALRARVENGTYEVDGHAVAERMISGWRNSQGGRAPALVGRLILAASDGAAAPRVLRARRVAAALH